MENLSLYQITDGFMNLMNKIETEEITEEEQKEIETALIEALQNKSMNIIGYIQNENSLINAIDEQIKRLQEFKKHKQNGIDRFKEYVKDNMNRLDIIKFETPIGSLSIAKSPISVEITNEDLIPEEYKTEVKTIKVDKKKIADNFKATGEIIDGVIIHTDNTNLRVK